MKGILLIAVGSDPELRQGYRNWAKNMIRSIRYYSPEIPVQLLHDGDEPELGCDYYTNVSGVCDTSYTGQYEPAELKLRLDHFTVFDQTLYLDVDGIAINDLEPLFEACKGNFCTQITGKISKTGGQKYMLWAKSDVIWEKFGLPEDAEMPAANTSFIYFEKTNVFKDAYNLFKTNPLRPEELNSKWGRSASQPDEFYINLALMTNSHKEVRPIFFKTVIDTSKFIGIDQVREDFYLIGCFGGTRYNHVNIEQFYNMVMRETGGESKYHMLMKKKFYELQKANHVQKT